MSILRLVSNGVAKMILSYLQFCSFLYTCKKICQQSSFKFYFFLKKISPNWISVKVKTVSGVTKMFCTTIQTMEAFLLNIFEQCWKKEKNTRHHITISPYHQFIWKKSFIISAPFVTLFVFVTDEEGDFCPQKNKTVWYF